MTLWLEQHMRAACQKTMLLTRSMKMKEFILHGKPEMAFLRFAPKKRPAQPEKPVDMMKNEGLAALHCLLLCVQFFFDSLRAFLSRERKALLRFCF